MSEPRVGAPLSRVRRRLIEEALEIEREDALQAGALAFMCRLFCQVGLPHSDPARRRGVPPEQRHLWKRDNGLVKLSLVGNPDVGLPSGKIPRQVMVYLTTECVRTGSPHVVLGNLTSFLRELSMGAVTGGRWGTATRIREQLQKLFITTVNATLDFTDPDSGRRSQRAPGFRLTEDYELCWHPRQPEQGSLWASFVDLTPSFFRMVRERPVPLDRRALRVLRSSLAIDLYVWLTYRYSYLEVKREISWPLLERQFGSNYATLAEFRRNVLIHLREVLTVYPSARVEVGSEGLILKPSPSHVAPLALSRRNP